MAAGLEGAEQALSSSWDRSRSSSCDLADIGEWLIIYSELQVGLESGLMHQKIVFQAESEGKTRAASKVRLADQFVGNLLDVPKRPRTRSIKIGSVKCIAGSKRREPQELSILG